MIVPADIDLPADRYAKDATFVRHFCSSKRGQKTVSPLRFATALHNFGPPLGR